jgi:hypothetical protein
MAQPGGREVESRLPFRECSDDAGAPADFAQDTLEGIINRYEILGAAVRLRGSRS